MTYEEAIKYLESLAGFGIRPGSERIKALVNALDNPQNKYKTAHVTGTNGKGSVCAIMAQILTESGMKTGLFTSPHLSSYRERIRIDGKDISKTDFANLVALIKRTIKKLLSDGIEQPTLFEVLTAMAFKHFADKKVDCAVIEVGLGGLLDSTNIINPEVCVITNVANDHANRCGGDLKGIAMHKAGIIKPGVPVFTMARGQALDIIRQTAESVDSEVYAIDNDNLYGCKLPIALKGAYQQNNAMLAALAVQAVNVGSITPEIVDSALSHVKWPGRFELFNVSGNFNGNNIGNKKILIDGAHNGAGAKVLRDSIDIDFPYSKKIFLFGVLNDKDIDTMIYNLFSKDDFVIVTKPDSERAADPDDVCLHIRAHSVDAIPVADNQKAFDMFLQSNADLLIAAGSLYLIGKFRDFLIDNFGV